MQVKFDADRSDLETKKAALWKRVEDAENQLKPVAAELDGLKYHVSQMTAANFGK